MWVEQGRNVRYTSVQSWLTWQMGTGAEMTSVASPFGNIFFGNQSPGHVGLEEVGEGPRRRESDRPLTLELRLLETGPRSGKGFSRFCRRSKGWSETTTGLTDQPKKVSLEAQRTRRP